MSLLTGTNPLLAVPPNVPSEYPEPFYQVNLNAINDSRQWVQFCVFLAKHGIPCHDKFLEVVSTLAKWFAYVGKLYHLRPDLDGY